MSVLIFANGTLDLPVWVRPYLDQAVVVIAADGGLRHALALGRRPDVIIGDLDSLPSGIDLAAVASEIIRHPADKNETDLELALLLATERFPDHELLIVGGFGGRIDHTLANILLLAQPRLVGRPIRFVHDHQSAWLAAGQTEIRGRPGDIVSLIPLGGDVYVRQTTGLRWPLRNEWLRFGPARGISNELMAEQATVTLGQGLLLCVHVAAQLPG